MVLALIGCLLAAAGPLGMFVFCKLQLARSSSAASADVLPKIDTATKTAKELAGYVGSYRSKTAFEKLVGLIESTQADLARESQSLKDVENKLSVAQSGVEEREAKHQELKAAHEGDELRMAELKAAYDTHTSQSKELEANLANSMKNLDQIMSEVSLTDDQKLLFQPLAESLSDGGSQLRELIAEYNSVTTRIKTLEEQHRDLEQEYTRLVEQQLGEL